MNTEFVINMSSKADYFDSDRVLSKWGFTESQCHCCGISNSELNGLLMQCGKCKQAYYCGMKCFNDHLPEHQKYCGTKEMFSQPTGSGVEMACKKKPILDEDDLKKAPVEEPESNPKRKTPKKKKSKKSKEAKSKSKPKAKRVPEEESVELTVDDLALDNVENQASKLEDSKVLRAEEEEEEEFDIGELADQMSALGKLDYVPAAHDSVSKMNHSFSEFGSGRRNTRPIPTGSAFAKESVDLRQTEMFKREYSWMTPEWINKQLKKTPRGRDLLDKGNSGPVTDIRFLLEEGLITWEEPSWTKPKLKPTQRGKQIKEEALELENSFREEFGHSSFCT